MRYAPPDITCRNSGPSPWHIFPRPIFSDSISCSSQLPSPWSITLSLVDLNSYNIYFGSELVSGLGLSVFGLIEMSYVNSPRIRPTATQSVVLSAGSNWSLKSISAQPEPRADEVRAARLGWPRARSFWAQLCPEWCDLEQRRDLERSTSFLQGIVSSLCNGQTVSHGPYTCPACLGSFLGELGVTCVLSLCLNPKGQPVGPGGCTLSNFVLKRS